MALLQALAEEDRCRRGSGAVRPGSIYITNHCRSQKLDTRMFRRILRSLMHEVLERPSFELDVHVVGKAEITQLNEEYVRHKGITDVITFDYGALGESRVHGEIFVCLDEGVRQAKRFRVPWQEELVRYAVHGILHLCGFDDQKAAARREMKKAENGALEHLRKQYYFPKLTGHRAIVGHA
jgi:probable rRNA maturation factor